MALASFTLATLVHGLPFVPPSPSQGNGIGYSGPRHRGFLHQTLSWLLWSTASPRPHKSTQHCHRAQEAVAYGTMLFAPSRKRYMPCEYMAPRRAWVSPPACTKARKYGFVLGTVEDNCQPLAKHLRSIRTLGLRSAPVGSGRLRSAPVALRWGFQPQTFGTLGFRRTLPRRFLR